jgi:hypothetical protein
VKEKFFVKSVFVTGTVQVIARQRQFYPVVLIIIPFLKGVTLTGKSQKNCWLS